MPHVEKEFIGSTDYPADSRIQSVAAQLEWVVGFIGTATAQRWEGRVFLPENSWAAGWSPFICDHQMESVDMHN
jgi:hypothetical protein